MAGGGSIQLLRIFGIRIGASPSWFFVLFLMIYWLTGYFGDVLSGSNSAAFFTAVAAALLFFASLVLHELGHALVARRNGIGIAGIDLWFFGGLAKLTKDTDSPGAEFRIAAAGPAVTLLVVAACVGVSALASHLTDFADSARFEDVRTTPAIALIGWLATINAFLLVFNLVPALPLDGGRIIRAIAWKVTGDRHRATRLAGRMGQGFSYLLIGVGVYVLATSDPINGISFLLLGVFIGQAAKAAVVSTEFSERIEGVTIADIMDAEPVVVRDDTPLLQAQDEFFLRYRWSWFPVVDAAGRFLGILRSERVDQSMAAGQPALPVADVLEEGGPDPYRIGTDQPLEALLGSEGLRRLGAIVAVDAEGRLRGVVTLDQVRRALTAFMPAR